MHILQPKQKKLKKEEIEKFLERLNISLTQLPKIRLCDPSIMEGCEVSDVLEIERVESDGTKSTYYRVVVV